MQITLLIQLQVVNLQDYHLKTLLFRQYIVMIVHQMLGNWDEYRVHLDCRQDNDYVNVGELRHQQELSIRFTK